MLVPSLIFTLTLELTLSQPLQAFSVICTVVTVISSWMLLTLPGNLLAVTGMLLVNAATFGLTFYLTVFEVIPEAYATMYASIRVNFAADKRNQDPPKGEM